MTATKRSQRKGGGRAYHSVLEPHFDFIRALRRQRRTWREIAELLASEKGLNVSLHAAYRYCRRRLRRGPSWEDDTPHGRAPRGSATATPAEEPDPASTPVATPPLKPYLPTHTFRTPDPKNLTREEFP